MSSSSTWHLAFAPRFVPGRQISSAKYESEVICQNRQRHPFVDWPTPAAYHRKVPWSGRLMIGETISHYRMLQQLGGGGMGVVYAAEDLDSSGMLH